MLDSCRTGLQLRGREGREGGRGRSGLRVDDQESGGAGERTLAGRNVGSSDELVHEVSFGFKHDVDLIDGSEGGGEVEAGEGGGRGRAERSLLPEAVQRGVWTVERVQDLEGRLLELAGLSSGSRLTMLRPEVRERVGGRTARRAGGDSLATAFEISSGPHSSLACPSLSSRMKALCQSP